MVHVDDVVEFAYRAACSTAATGKIYILSHSDAISTRVLYDSIRDSLGLKKKNWSIPLFCLKTAAWIGTLLGKISGKRMPLDMETLQKLTGSAWYSSARAEHDLGYRARHSVKQWLNGMAD
jgi:nucleoside-diphosphate-sugar epimerase